VRDAVLGAELAATGFFNEKYLRHLVDAHQSGLRDYAAPLWSLLMFQAFLAHARAEQPAVEGVHSPRRVSA